jgi:translation elongation factor EF-G
MIDQLPIQVLISRPSAPSQLDFAGDAKSQLVASTALEPEATLHGLLLHGLWELELESAWCRLRETYPDATAGNPRVKYRQGMEPWLSFLVSIPEPRVSLVTEDVLSRRGRVIATRPASHAVRVEFEVPAGEHWGYSTVLRTLTGARGQVEAVQFAGYRPWPGRDGGEESPTIAD